MIVNPKLFRNRLINSSILITVAVTTVYGFFSFVSLQLEQSQLEKENKLLENELSVMIEKFDQVQDTNQSLYQEYKEVKDSIQTTTLVVESLKTELALIPKMKKKVASYSDLNATLNSEKDSLEKLTNELIEEKIEVSDELKDQKKQNKILKEETTELKKVIKETKIVTTNSLKAKAMSASFLGKKQITKRAAKAKMVEINFSLDKNLNIESGKKLFYIQVIGPDRNVVSDKGAVNFGSSSLIYSLKKIIHYRNEALDVKALIKNKDTFKKGTYYINVFHNSQKVGSTKIILK